MSQVNVNTPGEPEPMPPAGGTGYGMIVGILVAILVIALVVWLLLFNNGGTNDNGNNGNDNGGQTTDMPDASGGYRLLEIG